MIDTFGSGEWHSVSLACCGAYFDKDLGKAGALEPVVAGIPGLCTLAGFQGRTSGLNKQSEACRLWRC